MNFSEIKKITDTGKSADVKESGSNRTVRRKIYEAEAVQTTKTPLHAEILKDEKIAIIARVAQVQAQLADLQAQLLKIDELLAELGE